MSKVKIEPQIFSGASGEIKAFLHQNEHSTGSLAVLLPGAGDSFREPLLRYSLQILLKRGFKVLALDKVYGDDPEWRNLTVEQDARKIVEDDTVKVFEQISRQFSDPIDLLIGRSLGTFAIACLLDRQLVAPKKIIWQTPALGGKWATMRDCKIPSFGILGTADYYYRMAIENMPKDRIIIENADHGMEIPGDPIQSIEILKQVMIAVDGWMIERKPSVQIVPYRTEWIEQFQLLRDKLSTCLKGLFVSIDHIGSTAVPGLGSKDRIDVQVTVKAISENLKYDLDTALIAGGFSPSKWSEDHRPPDDTSPVQEWKKLFLSGAHPELGFRSNIHIRVESYANQIYPILFREYLRQHRQSAMAYQKVKEELARYHGNSMIAYSELKDPICDLIMVDAKRWAEENKFEFQ